MPKEPGTVKPLTWALRHGAVGVDVRGVLSAHQDPGAVGEQEARVAGPVLGEGVVREDPGVVHAGGVFVAVGPGLVLPVAVIENHKRGMNGSKSHAVAKYNY